MRTTIFFALIPVLSCGNSLSAGIISDGDFTDWSYGSTVLQVTSFVPSASVTPEAVGGNPGARLNLTTQTGFNNVYPYDTAFGLALKTDAYVATALEGLSFVLSLDVLRGPGSFGSGQAIRLLVEQDGVLYGGSYLGVSAVPPIFFTRTFGGTFVASEFSRYLSTEVDNTEHPVFDGSVATRFGFLAGNSISGNLTMFYDNFVLQIPDVEFFEGPIPLEPDPDDLPGASSPVPEPASGLLFATGGLVMLLARPRRRGAKSPCPPR